MATPTAGQRVEAALVTLLARSTREQLYAPALAPVADIVDTVRYPVLSAVARFGPISAADIAIHVGTDRTVASRHAAALETAGLLTRDVDPADARAWLLQLTPRGRSVIRGIRSRMAATIEASMADWPDGVADAFVDGLERFSRALTE
ncbi:MarR family winged helix-turn-helix transcriptional regulator [Williamsia sp. CHRR-6]|uniref:MarR family winged helix-turn-helix transcriptional regulator n=1 Tax=Williamsia sp. CHRR-6 TaxID=2835871 RepID=UPI001BDAF8FE|nr:MarR family transcriptional regulator [Williamsia sp. CHRR-6]MBT0566526.1 MarR family transcriptional regulator [Williamsia sp. CHRR-6]